MIHPILFLRHVWPLYRKRAFASVYVSKGSRALHSADLGAVIFVRGS